MHMSENKKRTIHDIKPPTLSRRSVVHESSASQATKKAVKKAVKKASPKPSSASFESSVYPQSKKPWLWLGGIVAILVIAFVGMTAFSRATVTVRPVATELIIENTSLTAVTDATGEQLPYTLVAFSESLSERVIATGVRTVEERAQGTIRIINDHSSEAVRLREETRFESPDGKIYKTKAGSSITVPGKQGNTPGQIEVEVFADQPGESYNSGLTDFTLPGFRGTAREKTVYARSVTPMTGGVLRDEPVLANGDITTITETLRNTLIQKARDALYNHSDPDQVVLPLEDQFVFESSVRSEPESNQAFVEETIIAYAVSFPNESFAEVLLASQEHTLARVPARLTDPSGLSLTRIVGEIPSDITAQSSLTLELSGVAPVTWIIPEEAIKNTLLGLAEDQFEVTMASFEALQEARIRIQPPWVGRIPKNPDRISIVQSL